MTGGKKGTEELRGIFSLMVETQAWNRKVQILTQPLKRLLLSSLNCRSIITHKSQNPNKLSPEVNLKTNLDDFEIPALGVISFKSLMVADM